MRDLITKFHSQSESFATCTPWMWGYQALHLEDGGHKACKEDMLNKCSKQDFVSISLPVIVAPILKVDDMVRYQMIVHMQPKNSLLPFTEWLLPKIMPAITSFSTGKFHWELTLSENPALIIKLIFYNNCLINRTLIGSFLSSIRVQTDKI